MSKHYKLFYRFFDLFSHHTKPCIKVAMVILAVLVVKKIVYLVLQHRLEKACYNLGLYARVKSEIHSSENSPITKQTLEFPKLSNYGWRKITLKKIPTHLELDDAEKAIKAIGRAIFRDLAAVYEVKVIGRRKWVFIVSQLSRDLHFDSLKADNVSEAHAKLGRSATGRNLSINFKVSPVILALAAPGGGKTNLAASLAATLNVGSRKKEVFFLSTKLGDASRFHEVGIEPTLIDANDLTALSDKVQSIEKTMLGVAHELASLGLSDVWERDCYPIRLIVADELGVYCNSSNKAVVQSILNICRQGRALGFYFIGLNQAQEVGALPIPRSMISCLIAARTNTREMSKSLFGSEIAWDKGLTSGRFVIDLGDGPQKFVAPLIPRNKVSAK